jgi:hypothetical protein
MRRDDDAHNLHTLSRAEQLAELDRIQAQADTQHHAQLQAASDAHELDLKSALDAASERVRELKAKEDADARFEGDYYRRSFIREVFVAQVHTWAWDGTLEETANELIDEAWRDARKAWERKPEDC